MFEDYFRDILSPYFEFQKFNSCCRLIHLGGGLNFNYFLFVQKKKKCKESRKYN